MLTSFRNADSVSPRLSNMAESNSHFQPVFPWHDIHTFSIRSCAMLTVRPFTGALDLVRPTLDVGTTLAKTTVDVDLSDNRDKLEYDNYRCSCGSIVLQF